MTDYNLLGTTGAPMISGAACGANLFVKQDTGGDMRVVHAAAGTDLIIGVSLEATTVALQPLAIQSVSGTFAKVISGAAVSKGAKVTSDSAGKAVTCATGDTQAGVAFSASGGSGDVIIVQLTSPNGSGPTTP